MKLRRVLSGLFGVLVITSSVAAPHAAAEACRWIAHDLPVPPGAKNVEIRASSGDNTLIVGWHGYRGLVWWNGDLWQMDEPPHGASTNVIPWGINNSAVVVGGLETYPDGGGLDRRAFRYQYGQYQLLQTASDEQSVALGVNDNGDVVGEVWKEPNIDWRTVVVWPANGPRKDFERGDAVGISSDGKVVANTRLAGDRIGWVKDINTGVKTTFQGPFRPMRLDNDRILYSEGISGGGDRIVEQGLDGQRVATYADGTHVFGRTSSGTVFGAVSSGVAHLWQWGTHYAVDAEKLPSAWYYGDVTDGGGLVGTYMDADGGRHPARWFWCA
ncbi:hypothetical protein LFM09_08110 [Lentzea alba]|uniref:hypothetical protein n=1 Tax=Lentzea alba TaxID=2714351 RepID=UPI0039BF9F90